MKVMSDLYEKMIRESLFENDNSMVHGHKTYIVKAMCMMKDSDEEVHEEFTVQASSPEQAKTAAMKMAMEMGRKSCKATGVDMVPNSGEELNNYGSGKDLGADDSQTAGKVKPSDVSPDLDNHDA